MQPADDFTNPLQGRVVWRAGKSLWYLAALAVTVLLAPRMIERGAVLASFLLTVATLCLGHTVGMHRRLIHRSFECPLWVERILVYFGVLVGIAGPHRIVYLHDIRDWAQRHPACHPFFIHTQAWWKDCLQQLHCELRLDHPPRFALENRILRDPFYAWLERTWMLQQIPLAAALYLAGGLAWVVWGIAVRLCVSLTGHWLVGYLAHNRGGRHWHIEHAAVQGYNVPGFALLTMGESWHNNHHAYPESARLGLRAGEWDPGWLVLRGLERLGLAWNIATPEKLPARPERIALTPAVGDFPLLSNGCADESRNTADLKAFL